MTKKRSGARVREPLQVYLTSDERRILDRLAAHHSLSRAEVLRQGMRSFAKERNMDGGLPPMLKFMERMRGDDLPADIGRNHDHYLTEAIVDDHAPKKRSKRP